MWLHHKLVAGTRKYRLKSRWFIKHLSKWNIFIILSNFTQGQYMLEQEWLKGLRADPAPLNSMECHFPEPSEGQVGTKQPFVSDMPLLRSSSPSCTALAPRKRMPRQRVIRPLMTLQWRLMAKNFDDQCTSTLERRSSCTRQEKKGGCERKTKGWIFTHWHNSEVIPLMALNLQWCQPDSGRCLKMAETDEQEDGNRM